MRLYDTATRTVMEVTPRDGRVGIYVCGITPYDAAHLGHAFTYHVFDVITRRLRSDGVSVRHVRNVTDVDDDLLRAARERHTDFRVLASDQVAQFDRDMSEIGLLAVDADPRATGHVPEMVEWIARLADTGVAYERDGWVYFDVTLFPPYGNLSKLDEAAMTTLSKLRGADPDDLRKRHPLDFVLWQRSGEGEPRWPSPWGDGRPGWHIECSVLSTGELGHPIDIHGGGDDLIYPHHESEIAQAEAIGVQPYVRHWVHAAMVRLHDEKMSKSLGNLVFVRDLLDKAPGAAVRLLLAAHHYRESWTYEAGELADAETRRRRLFDALRSGSALETAHAGELQQRFYERVDDDLDTPGALRVLDEAAEALSQSVLRSGAPRAVSAEEVMAPMHDILGVAVTSEVA